MNDGGDFQLLQRLFRSGQNGNGFRVDRFRIAVCLFLSFCLSCKTTNSSKLEGISRKVISENNNSGIYQFSKLDVTKLKAIDQEVESGIKNYFEIHQFILAALERPSRSPQGSSDVSEVKKVSLWVKGAFQTNSNRGLFAVLIREYTRR